MLSKLIAYIDARLKEKTTLAAIVGGVGLGTYYFTRSEVMAGMAMSIAAAVMPEGTPVPVQVVHALEPSADKLRTAVAAKDRTGEIAAVESAITTVAKG